MNSVNSHTHSTNPTESSIPLYQSTINKNEESILHRVKQFLPQLQQANCDLSKLNSKESIVVVEPSPSISDSTVRIHDIPPDMDSFLRLRQSDNTTTQLDHPAPSVEMDICVGVYDVLEQGELKDKDSAALRESGITLVNSIPNSGFSGPPIQELSSLSSSDDDDDSESSIE